MPYRIPIAIEKPIAIKKTRTNKNRMIVGPVRQLAVLSDGVVLQGPGGESLAEPREEKPKILRRQ